MAIVSKSVLLEAGVQFGHQTKRWNPKMKPYVFGTRDDIYIIDLDKTVAGIETAYEKIKEISTNGGTFLFVGTKKQASEVVKEEALRSNSFYVNERWLGGTLTNFRTIRRRINRLEEIEKMEKDGVFEVLPKKEVIGLKKEYEKLNKLLAGIRGMVKLPQAMIIVDSKKEESAIHEANILNIPVFGLIDTNCDPDHIDYVIPGNDDAIKSVKVVIGSLNNAICETRNLEMVDYTAEDEKTTSKENKETVKAEENVEPAKKEKDFTKSDYKKMTVGELKKIAKENNIKGYSKMTKDELISSLERN